MYICVYVCVRVGFTYFNSLLFSSFFLLFVIYMRVCVHAIARCTVYLLCSLFIIVCFSFLLLVSLRTSMLYLIVYSIFAVHLSLRFFSFCYRKKNRTREKELHVNFSSNRNFREAFFSCILKNKILFREGDAKISNFLLKEFHWKMSIRV